MKGADPLTSPETRKVCGIRDLTALFRLAMYYNGYIIICIFIGSYLGSFIFQWEPLTER